MNYRSVLIVEDEESIRSSLQDVLEVEGYSTIEAMNGNEALEKLNELGPHKAPGIILLDLMMPIMDGRTFLNAIESSNEEWLKNIPIVITSAVANFHEEQDLPLALKRIKKPFDLDDILSTIEQICGKPQL